MFNKKLKQIRKRVKLSQLEMAERLHMSQSAYCKLENDASKLDKDRIVMIVKEFGEQAVDLLELDGIEIVFKNNPNYKETIIFKTDKNSFHNLDKENNEYFEFLQTLIHNLQEEKQQLLRIVEQMKS